MSEVQAAVQRVCRRIPPLWDLANFVAVNPFLGFIEEPWDQAARTVRDGLGAQVFPPLEYYRRHWGDRFGLPEVEAAARRHGVDADSLVAALTGSSAMPSRPQDVVFTHAERYDQDHRTRWNDAVVREIARWCAVYVEDGGTYWPLPPHGEELFLSWRETARVDRTLEIAGLRGWRRWMAQLPESPWEALERLSSRHPMDAAILDRYLYRLLGSVYGWACYFKRKSWDTPAAPDHPLADLLAVRMCADYAVMELLEVTPLRLRPINWVVDETALGVLQDAFEDGYANRLLQRLNAGPTGAGGSPDVQAVFCLDVRSEPFRRHLEGQSPDIETVGCAGFFGLALRLDGGTGSSARCPVFLAPDVSGMVKPAGASVGALKYVQGAPAGAFSYVETLGLAYGLFLALDAVHTDHLWPGNEALGACALDPMPAPVQVEVASQALRRMGLLSRLAPLVLLCGHESESANNPHAAGLDCGACGGHSGAVNARLVASLLNRQEVRAGLQARDIIVPAETWFLAAVHNTTTDDVVLLDAQVVPESHGQHVSRLRRWLAEAGSLNRSERAPALGLASQPGPRLHRQLRARAQDWSEVRPEWGLARNAAFLAAPRARSRGVDLQGRCFLHDYDWTTDPDAAELTFILCGPMVVAAWINLQYFASTVDNGFFGCGTKALHNRVGLQGVVLGNGGDLRTGLTQQSVHAPDGTWYHEPIRLQVMVAAPPDRIDCVLSSQPSVRHLVENGWVSLFALEPETFRFIPGQGWQPWTADRSKDAQRVGGA